MKKLESYTDNGSQAVFVETKRVDVVSTLGDCTFEGGVKQDWRFNPDPFLQSVEVVDGKLTVWDSFGDVDRAVDFASLSDEEQRYIASVIHSYCDDEPPFDVRVNPVHALLASIEEDHQVARALGK